MAAGVTASVASLSSLLPPPSKFKPASSPPFPSLFLGPSLLLPRSRLSSLPPPPVHQLPPRASRRPDRLLCKAAEYKFPDPIPEFAATEVNRFKTHMLEKLTKNDEFFGDSIGEVVDVCTEIFSEFLHTEYGGPGTLLVIPFIDMADTLREKGLPGAPQAARAAVLWAQKHVDKDWNKWTAGEDSDSD